MFFTAKSLRDYLESILKDQLGSMKLSSGSVVSAVFVGEPPIGSKITGLELNIPRNFSGNSSPLTGGVAPSYKFNFSLVQHSGSDKLGEAKEIVMQAMAPINCQYLPAIRDPSGQQLTLDQCSFSFSRSALVVLR